MCLVYPETLIRTIGEEEFKQLANIIDFRIFNIIFPREMYHFLSQEDVFFKGLLIAKIEVGTSCFFTNLKSVSIKIVNSPEFILARDV